MFKLSKIGKLFGVYAGAKMAKGFYDHRQMMKEMSSERGQELIAKALSQSATFRAALVKFDGDAERAVQYLGLDDVGSPEDFEKKTGVSYPI